MPFLIRWPGVVKPGSRPQEMIQNIDYAPTFLEAAGLDIPCAIQGRSLLPLFKGQAKDWRKSLLYTYYEFGEHRVPQHFGVRTDRYKLMHFPRSNEWNLFDLQEDPGEMKSVHDSKDYKAIRANLEKEYHRLREFYDAPPLAAK